jgi:hypothetical protein
LRLRFDERELSLLRGAEQVRGAALAHGARPEALRNALSLSRAGHKLAHAHPGSSIILDEGEVQLLLDALHFATTEVHWVSDQANQSAAAGAPGRPTAERQASVMSGFPELKERGLWRTFGLCRELEGVASRLQNALSA